MNIILYIILYIYINEPDVYSNFQVGSSARGHFFMWWYRAWYVETFPGGARTLEQRRGRVLNAVASPSHEVVLISRGDAAVVISHPRGSFRRFVVRIARCCAAPKTNQHQVAFAFAFVSERNEFRRLPPPRARSPACRTKSFRVRLRWTQLDDGQSKTAVHNRTRAILVITFHLTSSRSDVLYLTVSRLCPWVLPLTTLCPPFLAAWSRLNRSNSSAFSLPLFISSQSCVLRCWGNLCS